MKSALIHLKNVFFGALIKASGNDIDVYGQDGTHMVAVRDGRCASKELGCSHEFTLDPVPRDGRLFKMDQKGNIVQDEKYAERLLKRKKFLDADGVLMPMSELIKKGYEFDAKGNVTVAPQAAQPQAEVQA